MKRTGNFSKINNKSEVPVLIVRRNIYILTKPEGHQNLKKNWTRTMLISELKLFILGLYITSSFTHFFELENVRALIFMLKN